MEKLSKEWAIRLHRMEWDELAEKGCGKIELSIWKHNGGSFDYNEVCNGCFLCEYTEQSTSNVGRNKCSSCPLRMNPVCSCDSSIFTKWRKEENLTDKKLYAAQLRDYGLDIKPEEKTAEEAVEEVYRVGQRFMEEGSGEYILAQSDSNTVLFVGLSHGNRWTEPVMVKDREAITRDEIRKMSGIYGLFALIK